MKTIHIAMLVGLILLGAACSPAGSQTPPTSKAPTPSPPTATPVVSPGPTEDAAVSLPELLTHPITSSTGVILEVPRVTHETGCVTLSVSLSGIYPPDGSPPDYTPPAPVVDATIFYDGAELVLEPRGGGGGGGQTPDGSLVIGQGTIYESSTPLPAGVQLPMIVELTLDSFFGFVSPLQFAVQGEPDERPNCGTQLSMVL